MGPSMSIQPLFPAVSEAPAVLDQRPGSIDTTDVLIGLTRPGNRNVRPAIPVIDAVAVIGGAVLAHFLSGEAFISLELIVTVLLAAALGVYALRRLDAARPSRQLSVQLILCLAVWGGVTGLLFCLASIAPPVDPFFWSWALKWAGLAAVGVIATRAVTWASVRWLARTHRPARLASDWSGVAKRALDIVLSGLILVIVSPVMLLAAIAIWINSPGPILFRQTRFGFNNEVFVIYKFRSMLHEPEPGDDAAQATRIDPRVSRVGAFLRRKSLDELPQLLNVLRGDMSLVGPRPHAVAHHYMYADIVEDYLARHRMRPGITGWAQVHGLRGETSAIEAMRRRVAFDLDYIENWSLWLDLRIILQTAFMFLWDRNAY